MARLPRHALRDGRLFHVTARGVDRAAIFRDDADRRTFLTLLADCVRRFRWRCHAFCLMGNHYHLVVEPPELAALSAGVHRLNGVYAQRFNRKHGRSGHLFGDRYSTWLVHDEAHYEATCAYVLANPVRAGLCDDPDEWPWSGIRLKWPPAPRRTYVRRIH
jgi:REP element-mobilizing transposase RayT